MFPKEFIDDMAKAFNQIIIFAVVGVVAVLGAVGYGIFKLVSHFMGS